MNVQDDNELLMQKIRLLPDYVCDRLFMGAGVEANISIAKDFNLSDQQSSEMMDLVMQIVFKEIKIEDLAIELEKRLLISEDVAKEIALALLTRKLYLAKDFFPGIGDEIIKLGGEVPGGIVAVNFVEQINRREEEIEAMQRQEEEEREQEMAVATVYGKIAELLVKFPDLGEQLIGSQNSIEVSGLPIPMKPMIRYWVHDYKEKTGHGNHSNLERVQYVCHDKNTRSMNSEERRQLMLILKSADSEIDLPYSPKLKKIDFSLLPEE